MAPPHTMQLAGRGDWALMIAIHDALRRDLDQLLHATASHASARVRWGTFRRQLRFHLAAEHTAMWPRVKAKLADDPDGQALLDAMDDEHQLLGPLQVMIDDAFTMDADPGRLRELLARLRTADTRRPASGTRAESLGRHRSSRGRVGDFAIVAIPHWHHAVCPRARPRCDSRHNRRADH
jgi:hypothetical protein